MGARLVRRQRLFSPKLATHETVKVKLRLDAPFATPKEVSRNLEKIRAIASST
jgi:hypothetical protein